MGTSQTTLTLPWPLKELSPNARGHWRTLAKAKKYYREACATTARTQGLRKSPTEALHIDLVFYPPSRRRYDLDNLLASMKSGLDGLADVMQVDDTHWSISLSKVKDIGGYVKVTISENTNENI
jgi:crossover junction endodeoxyribonuclease RusA